MLLKFGCLKTQDGCIDITCHTSTTQCNRVLFLRYVNNKKTMEATNISTAQIRLVRHESLFYSSYYPSSRNYKLQQCGLTPVIDVAISRSVHDPSVGRSCELANPTWVRWALTQRNSCREGWVYWRYILKAERLVNTNMAYIPIFQKKYIGNTLPIAVKYGPSWKLKNC